MRFNVLKFKQIYKRAKSQPLLNESGSTTLQKEASRIRIRDVYPGSGFFPSQIQGQKAPEPGFGSPTMN
jgi:hypothetical protein